MAVIFAVNLAKRRQALFIDSIDALRASIRAVKGRHPNTREAMVVLHDHRHAFTPTYALPDCHKVPASL